MPKIKLQEDGVVNKTNAKNSDFQQQVKYYFKTLSKIKIMK